MGRGWACWVYGSAVSSRHYNTLPEGHIWLLIAYTKDKFDNLPTAFLKQLKEAISDG